MGVGGFGTVEVIGFFYKLKTYKKWMEKLPNYRFLFICCNLKNEWKWNDSAIKIFRSNLVGGAYTNYEVFAENFKLLKLTPSIWLLTGKVNPIQRREGGALYH